jgi:hypothetical protein
VRTEDKKYVWWGLLGIGVAALFYFLSAKQKTKSDTVTVPYLVPQTMQNSNSASPSAGPSLSSQPNIVGSSPNSTVPNFTMPNLMVYNPAGPYNNVQYGGFGNAGGWTVPSGIKTPDNSNNFVQANPYVHN